MKTQFFSAPSIQNTKQISRNIVANFKAVLQPANIVMFSCIIFFCFYKMEGYYANLAFVVVAFYVLTLYNTQGGLIRSVKQLEEELKKTK